MPTGGGKHTSWCAPEQLGGEDAEGVDTVGKRHETEHAVRCSGKSKHGREVLVASATSGGWTLERVQAEARAEQ